MSRLKNHTIAKVPESNGSVRRVASQRDRSDEVLLLSQKQWMYVQRRYSLTPRERQIAELICQGLRNGKIAKYLNIKPGTVKTHIRNIYRKVRVESKIAMLLKFVTEARDFSGRHHSIPSTHIMD